MNKQEATRIFFESYNSGEKAEVALGKVLDYYDGGRVSSPYEEHTVYSVSIPHLSHGLAYPPISVHNKIP